MTSIASMSQSELIQRRQQLRRQRRVKFFQAGWRGLAVISLTSGVVWAFTLPFSVIRYPEQVTIEGNQYIPSQTIRAQLPITYPQSLLRIQPQELADALKAKAPIAEATVDRQLFPPSLTIRIRERTPVALTVPSPSAAKTAGAGTPDSQLSDTGLLDEAGNWMPLESYTALNKSLKLPALRVLGKPDQYRPYWIKLYQAVSRSPVKITEINWGDPNNLILRTELGFVHFGAYGTQFGSQLQALDQMRRLSAQVSPSQIAYIDLRNPEAPALQMVTSKSPVKLGTP